MIPESFLEILKRTLSELMKVIPARMPFLTPLERYATEKDILILSYLPYYQNYYQIKWVQIVVLIDIIKINPNNKSSVLRP